MRASATREPGAVERGAVYTPETLADWVASEVAGALPAGPATVADLACGRGALLSAIGRHRRSARLIGIDVDPDDIDRAAGVVPNAELTLADGLAGGPITPGRQVDAVILNPPWGIRLPHSPAELRAMGYALAVGQFESASVFVERALEYLRPGGVAGLIVPDSLFSPEHERLRRLLIGSTELLLLARLGEGHFPGVYRGTAVVVLRKQAARSEHEVRCLALSADDRRAVLSSASTLQDVCGRRAHLVPQRRFADSIDSRLDIGARADHAQLLRAGARHASKWSSWFVSSRGIELGKAGEVVRCPVCRYAWPRPRGVRVLECAGCEQSRSSDELSVERIVRAAAAGRPGPWKPLIVGADVGRYACAPSKQVLGAVAGINYKSPQPPGGLRLLIRKTGIGLRAALTDRIAYTNQVVFDYRLRPGAPALLLPYTLGVLCSRVVLAIHLLSSGDSNWRSHPYVTQRVLACLPVPDPFAGCNATRLAREIAERASTLATSYDAALDLEVEERVMRLFGLPGDGAATVAAVLEEAQGLQGISELRFDPAALATRAA